MCMYCKNTTTVPNTKCGEKYYTDEVAEKLELLVDIAKKLMQKIRGGNRLLVTVQEQTVTPSSYSHCLLLYHFRQFYQLPLPHYQHSLSRHSTHHHYPLMGL